MLLKNKEGHDYSFAKRSSFAGASRTLTSGHAQRFEGKRSSEKLSSLGPINEG